MAEAKLNERQLAEHVGADPKTVSRWVSDEHRLPHPRTRWAVAELLGADEMALWPAAARAALKVGPDREVHAVHPSRAGMPTSVWQRLIGDAGRELALCGYTSYFLWQAVPNLSALLRVKAESGTRVRVVLGDPEAEITNRPIGETTGGADGPLSLAARIGHTRHELSPLRDVVEVRQSDLGWGREVWRSDNEAVVSWNVLGRMGSESPLFHIRRHMDGGLFDQVAVRHVDALWSAAVPVWP